MAALLTMAPFLALSSSVRRSLKEKGLGLVVLLLLVTLPIFVLVPGLPIAGLILTSVAAYWLWLLVRRLWARVATRALAAGNQSRAKRLYWVLYLSSVGATARASSALSLAACAASARHYDLAERRLAKLSNLEGALLAVSLNLQAYCQARQGRDLALALQLSREALKIRASVAGFRHTRGLLLLELGQLDDASRDLEASWLDGSGTGLFEAERCYDLGRLWSVRGQSEYGNDYFERSLRASPDSHWATMSEKLVSQSASLGIARGSGNVLDDFI